MEEALAGRLGRYALIGPVGRGGMGEVHRARAFGAAGVTKELCIKRIRCERLADPIALGRFVAEARVSMRLSHANIVSVFDFGRSENDYYLAMEWVDGCDLRRLIAEVRTRGERLDEDVVLFVAAEIARALAYVHELDGEQRVTHCDLKPANVLLSRAGDVKLADFGVAVPEDAASAGGTRRYMAPEQEASERVGPAVDLFALGRVIDELARGDDSLDAPTGSYVPPVHVSAPLGALVTRLLAHDPDARPASAREVLDALEAMLAEARMQTKRSPRDRLARDVSAIAIRVAVNDEAPADFRTDASFVTEGESETFARRMRPGASTRSEPRPTPLPPQPPRAPTRWAWVALALGLGLVALTFEVSPAPIAVVPSAPRVAPTISSVPIAVPARPEPAPAVAVPVPARAPRAPRTPAPELATTIVPPAIVRVNARPWAEVSIDGVPHGITPVIDVSLAPGAHEIVLRNPALDVTRIEHVEVASGEHRDVIADLRTPVP